MKAWIKVFPRPLGVEPKIYNEKPEPFVQTYFETPEGETIPEDPWGDYDVREFESELAARRWIKKMYPMSYNEFKECNK